MKLNILFGGAAGQGANILTHILSKSLIELGFYVFYYRDYQSLIRGGHNFNILTFSDKPVRSNENKLDLIVALDENTINLHKPNLKNKENIIFGKESNMFFAGKIFKTLGINFSILDKQLKQLKTRYNENLKEAKKGYNEGKKHFDLPNFSKKKLNFSSGTERVAIGAIKSGLNNYFAYPMTPATGVLNELAQRQKEGKHKVFELENEIAVANAGAGCAITGSKTMVGTSGGGFCLMTEALSMCGIAGIPLIFYLAQRAGPASGVATYNAQGDLKMALNSGHGEFTRLVFAPGDPNEAEELVSQMFYFTQKYSLPGILISDKHLAESFYSYVENAEILKFKSKTKFSRYTSYEQNSETGSGTEEAKIIKLNVETRKKKQKLLEEECEKFSGFKIHGKKSSKNCIVFWGSTKGAILDAIEREDVCAIQVLYINPFPKKIKKILENKKKIIAIENNATGQLCDLIREKTGILIDKKNKILRYDARPFFSDELKEEIKNKLK